MARNDGAPSRKDGAGLPGGGLWNENDVARVYKVHVQTVRRWRRAGTGPPYLTFGRTIRYAPAVVVRHIEAAQHQERKTLE